MIFNKKKEKKKNQEAKCHYTSALHNLNLFACFEIIKKKKKILSSCISFLLFYVAKNDSLEEWWHVMDGWELDSLIRGHLKSTKRDFSWIMHEYHVSFSHKIINNLL